MVIGLRPEHFNVANGGEHAATVPAVVEVVEYLGDEQLVHLRAGEIPLVAKLPVEPRLAAGEPVALAVALDKLYLFDQDSESALQVAA
jgi:ABC-type sugar transport system ATPase subunit